MKAIIKLVLVVIGAMIFALFKWQARRKATAQETAGGCVACGSKRLEFREGVRACLDCGYVGREDGGGQLGAHEIDAMYDHK